MNRLFIALQKYLFWAFPFVIISMIWSSQHLQAPDFSNSSFAIRWTWEFLSWNLMIWFACLLVALLLLLFRTSSGDLLLKRLANIKERDEREALITGIAAKSSFLATLALLIFLIGVTSLTVEVRNLQPHEISADGHKRTISIGTDFSLLDRKEVAVAGAQPALISKSGIPISKIGILVLILAWQILTFVLRARRELR